MGTDQLQLELGEGGLELEDIGGAGDEIPITRPYDPKEIRIKHQQPTVTNLIRRIVERELDISPPFQRRGGIWSERSQGRLIESLFLGIPLPAFFFDATDPDNWLVVDGLQRLTAIARYVVSADELAQLKLSRLVLSELEFLKEMEGVAFEKLPRRNRRAIEEAQVSAYLIEPGTPPEVKFNVFKRINTGGLPLSPQEIRHALNQGKAADFLEQLSTHPSFLQATANGISGYRMADRECVLRFFAFVDDGAEKREGRDFDFFLSERMKHLGTLSESDRRKLAGRLVRAMDAAYSIFGDDAFRKRYQVGEPRKPINKALFEAWAVGLDRRTDEELRLLAERRDDVIQGFIRTLRESKEFEASVSQGTGDARRIRTRFSAVSQILESVLGAP